MTPTAVGIINDVILTKLKKLIHNFLSMNDMPHPWISPILTRSWHWLCEDPPCFPHVRCLTQWPPLIHHCSCPQHLVSSGTENVCSETNKRIVKLHQIYSFFLFNNLFWLFCLSFTWGKFFLYHGLKKLLDIKSTIYIKIFLLQQCNVDTFCCKRWGKRRKSLKWKFGIYQLADKCME